MRAPQRPVCRREARELAAYRIAERTGVLRQAINEYQGLVRKCLPPDRLIHLKVGRGRGDLFGSEGSQSATDELQLGERSASRSVRIANSIMAALVTDPSQLCQRLSMST